MLGTVVVLILIFACGPAPARSQILPDTLLNQRVRLHLVRQDRFVEGAVSRQLLRGVLSAVSNDSVTIRVHPAASVKSVGSSGIHQIDLSRGVRRSRTVLRRSVSAAAIWALIGSFGDDEFGGGPTENALIWAAGGLAFGAVAGILWPEEEWKRVFRR
jgi:hypothetical protein